MSLARITDRRHNSPADHFGYNFPADDCSRRTGCRECDGGAPCPSGAIAGMFEQWTETGRSD